MHKGAPGLIGFALAFVAALAPAAAQPLEFELAGRYWYSTGKVNFGFTNGDPFFGDPTSTLVWSTLTGHSGEIYGRVTHESGYFLKGSIGGGQIGNGQIIDRDFLVGQFKFSDTYSKVDGNNLRYAIVDFGYGGPFRFGNHHVGAFVGYMFWKEKLTAFGVRCNPDDTGGFFCGPPGTVVVPFDVAALGYEPAWHALRIGGEIKYRFTPTVSVSTEVAWIPWARLQNFDYHFLRSDLALPSGTITSKAGQGLTAEIFLNYEIFPHIELGAGLRYWGIFANRGEVIFHFSDGTSSDPLPLRRFDQQRWGMIVQLKGTM